MYGNFQMLPSPTAEPVAASMKTQRLAQLPWTETLSVDIVTTSKHSKKRPHCPGFNQPAQARSDTVADSRATPYNAAPMAKQKKHPTGTIAQNKKARHDYFIEHKFEAGLVLAGWEVKSLRASKLQLVDSYVLLKDGEAWLLGSHITPLMTASTHVIADPTRTRKLLLNRRERSEEHTSELQSLRHVVCRLLLEKNKDQSVELAQTPRDAMRCSSRRKSVSDQAVGVLFFF